MVAIVDHVARCYRTDDEERVKLEMGKAEGHMDWRVRCVGSSAHIG